MDKLSNIDRSWTLFIDRDGVINHEKKEHYVLNWKEFIFYDHTKEALKILSEIFGTVIVVTNQRGVGKGLMTEEDLSIIHSNMKNEIVNASGRIDRIYFCSSMDNDCFERKPNPGMAHLAQKDFPQIDFSKSIMIGNKPSDMKFGKNAGMITVFVATTNPEVPFPHPDIDFRFNNLYDVSTHLKQLTLTKS